MKNSASQPDPYQPLSPPKFNLSLQALGSDSEKGSKCLKLKVEVLGSGGVHDFGHGGSDVGDFLMSIVMGSRYG